jgi:glycine cleavage system pyridoxal-binding protein P
LPAPVADKLAAIVFPQVNTFGLIEDFAGLTDLSAELGAKSVAVIDPLLLAKEGLQAPSDWGAQGADIIVGEAQHLALAPNFGGPGPRIIRGPFFSQGPWRCSRGARAFYRQGQRQRRP